MAACKLDEKCRDSILYLGTGRYLFCLNTYIRVANFVLQVLSPPNANPPTHITTYHHHLSRTLTKLTPLPSQQLQKPTTQTPSPTTPPQNKTKQPNPTHHPQLHPSNNPSSPQSKPNPQTQQSTPGLLPLPSTSSNLSKLHPSPPKPTRHKP